MFHDLLAPVGGGSFSRFFTCCGHKAIASGREPMLDSAAMSASARQLFATLGDLPLPGSLALLLRR
jgi:hypothetical protein